MNQPATWIDAIRQRPGMYLGSKSLTALYHFLGGYELACSLHRIKDERLGLEIPCDFHDWVAYRTHFRESTLGWCRMIVATSPSEEEAFDRFFELLKEHSERLPRLVAELIHPVSNSWTSRNGESYEVPGPEKVRIVTYTDDPGFFALHESEEWADRFHPFLSWMWGLSGGEWVIHDEAAFRRIQQATEQWERELDARLSNISDQDDGQPAAGSEPDLESDEEPQPPLDGRYL